MARPILILSLLAILKCSKSTQEREPNISYRSVRVDLNPKSTPTESVAVVRKKEESGIVTPFTKYVLFGTDRTEYFHAASVTFGEDALVVDREKVSVSYVYDVYTYWKESQILVAVFRYYHPGRSSYYKYYRRADKAWREVDGSEYDASSYGQLRNENLVKLLKAVELENPIPSEPGQPEDSSKTEYRKLTIIVVSVIAVALLVLMLVGLAFYFFR